MAGLRHVSELMTAAVVRLDEAAVARSRKSIVDTLADAGGWEAPQVGTERCRMLQAALEARNTPYAFKGGPGRHDAWSFVRYCAAFAAERDCVDIERTKSGWSNVNEASARLAFLQWGLTEIKVRHAEPGDVLLFRMPDDCGLGEGVHPAVLSSAGGELSWAMLPGKTAKGARMIHAHWGRGVVEAWLGGSGDEFWSPKLVAAFSFDVAGDRPRPFRLAA